MPYYIKVAITYDDEIVFWNEDKGWGELENATIFTDPNDPASEPGPIWEGKYMMKLPACVRIDDTCIGT
jgi:hypothetical protein